MKAVKKTIIISAGGTGGHIFPALAVAAELKQHFNIVWVGAKSGLENKIVPEHGYPLAMVTVGGVRNKGWRRKLFLPLTMLRAMLQSLIILIRYRPQLIIGFGGYATFPIALMGSLLARPVIIHEQNSVAGLTNRVLAKVAQKVLTAFPGVLIGPKTHLVGNPVRKDICALPSPEISCAASANQKLRVLIIGGSLGAKALNDTVPLALARIPERIESVLHQVGRGDATLVSEFYLEYKINAKVLGFIDEMALAYADADLIICRGGALTVAEVAAAGVAAIFVPYPYAVDDHQTGNANYLVEQGAAFLIMQQKLTPEALVEMIKPLTRASCRQIGHRARQLAITNSAELICQHVLGLIQTQ